MGRRTGMTMQALRPGTRIRSRLGNLGVCWPGLLPVAALSLVALVVFPPCGALAAPSAKSIIAHARAAAAKLYYEGDRVVNSAPTGGKAITATQRVYRGPNGRERVEIMAPKSIAGRLYVCDGHRQWRYYPKRHIVQIIGVPEQLRLGPLAPKSDEDTDDLPAAWHYTGKAHVAKRPCYVVGFTGPEGHLRTTLYIDCAHYGVLGLDRLDSAGTLLESWRFETVGFVSSLNPAIFTFRPPKSARVVEIRGNATRMSLGEAEKKLNLRAIIPTHLPVGYHLNKTRVAIVRRDSHHVLWLQFSNGAETFSMFESVRLPKVDAKKGGVTRWDCGRYTVIVVGRLTERELRRMRESLPMSVSSGKR